MQLNTRRNWSERFEEFWVDFSKCFKREETGQAAEKYVRGLLAEVERKNCWQLAEIMKENKPDTMQRLLYQAQWNADLVCKILRAKVIARLGYAPGVGVIDESAFVKRGDKSAGVGRQYCGRLGKIENCQVGVFLGYVAPLGYAFLDRELYLPKDWCEDSERRAEAKVPDEVTFATKPELAQKMLACAWAENIPLQWVVADCTYGNSPDLRNFIDAQKRYYVMEVPKTFHVRLADAKAVQTVSELVDSIPAKSWRRMAFGLGEKGLNFYDWTALRVTPTTDDVGEQWLLIRRPLNDSDGLTFYVSNAPLETSLETLAAVASSRWCVEQLLEEAKGEAGLDEYEVRYWHCWYRHITLSMVAHSWLTLLRHEERKKKLPTSLADTERCRTAQVAQHSLAHTESACGISPQVGSVAPT
jgi:SRSO17 transposase